MKPIHAVSVATIFLIATSVTAHAQDGRGRGRGDKEPQHPPAAAKNNGDGSPKNSVAPPTIAGISMSKRARHSRKPRNSRHRSGPRNTARNRNTRPK